MKKILLHLLLGIGLLAPTKLVFAAANSIDYSFKKPEDLNRNLAENPALFGFFSSSESYSTSAIPQQQSLFATSGMQWVSGEGVFQGVVIATAAATVYVVCADSAATTNTALNDTGWNLVLMPYFANTTNATYSYGSVTGGTAPPPIHFRKGLYCWTSAAVRYMPVWRAKQD